MVTCMALGARRAVIGLAAVEPRLNRSLAKRGLVHCTRCVRRVDRDDAGRIDAAPRVVDELANGIDQHTSLLERQCLAGVVQR